jgi:hypothetical protein
MEREHLIIIALILVALYMMNNDKKQDKVKAIGPMGRIRYEGDSIDKFLDNPGQGPQGHIRHRREGFTTGDNQDEIGNYPTEVGAGQHIRIRGDKDWGHSQHIKNHIRHNNRNNMFNGMMEGCGTKPMHIETFRFTEACGPNDMPC